jgi:hypothetical protein
MKRISLTDIHVYLTVVIYLASLFFPACYLGESREPQSSVELLVSGPFGIFVGAFAWYANLFLWIALAKAQKSISILFSSIALVLAISFFFYKRIMYIDLDFQKDITSIGWGYFLWVLSISIFLVGQFFRFCKAPKIFIPISALIPTLFFGNLFYDYYYINEGSQYQLQQERNRIYDVECREAVTKIYSLGEDIKSVYLKGNAGEYISKYNRWERQSGWLSISALVNSGYLQYGEEYNYNQTDRVAERNTQYTRYSSYSNSREYVNELTSDASITVEEINYPNRVNLKVGIITIEDRRNNKILAKSKYVFDEYGYRFCGETSKGKFSIDDLAMKTLQLKRQYSSIYDK